MASYNLTATSISTATPNKLNRGRVRIWASTPVYWVIGEHPTAGPGCAIIAANESIELRLPTSCGRLAVMAINEPGQVTVTELPGGARASCSA